MTDVMKSSLAVYTINFVAFIIGADNLLQVLSSEGGSCVCWILVLKAKLVGHLVPAAGIDEHAAW
jgi:hypothetical protein